VGGEIAHGSERQIDERRDDPEIERSPEHRSGVEQRARRRGEQPETRSDDVANAVRQASRDARHGPAISHEPQHLHDEQRIPLRRDEERVAVGDAFRRGPVGDLVPPEATKREAATFARDLRECVTCFRRETRLDVAVRGDEHDTRPT
jgi:hypothetical protein